MGRRQLREKNPFDQLEYCLLKKRRRARYKKSIPCKQSLRGIVSGDSMWKKIQNGRM